MWCARARCSARRSACSPRSLPSSASRPASCRRPTLAEWRAAMRPSTKLLFAETPTNPLTEVCDIARAGRHRARRRRAADGGQHLLLAGAAAAAGAGRRPGDACRHQVPRRPGPGDGRRAVRAAQADRRCVRPDAAHRRHDAGAVQRLGGAEGPGDAGAAHEGAERGHAGRGAVAGSAPGGVARVLPGPGVAPAACAGDAPAVGTGRRGAVLRRARRRRRGRARRGLPRHRQHPRAEHRHQPGRHQVDHHPSRHHLARPAQRGAAPGRRHRPGHDPRWPWAWSMWTTSPTTCSAGWAACESRP